MAMAQKLILNVEDNEMSRIMLTDILSEGYKVIEAENGQEALEILKEKKDEISLILLDVMMPVMDGYTFLDRVKEDEELALIPVIVMTQSNREEDEIAALSHGATDFIPKPYRPQVILHRVANLIKLREHAAMVNQFRYDRLTGLCSKEFFYRKVRKCLDANPDRAYTIVCSNIENFKLYNDSFGREAGDQMLRDYAECAQKMLADRGICGRYGADRFLFLVESEQEKKDRANFFQNVEAGEVEKTQNLSLKWGIYEISDPTIPVEKMCDRALLAVDSIKGQYNQIMAIYDDTLRSKLLQEKAITDIMRTSLDNREFKVYLQPKYRLDDESMIGAEALVRWIHPEWGFMSPGDFIPLFEKNGFITDLDQYVWEQVCKKLKKWKEMGYPLFPVSVNVSRMDVYQINLCETLVGIVQKYGIDPGYLHLEITESVYAENPTQLIETVEELRKEGFVIEMDDFGSGYSSLSMLNQMKIDILKLDMKFIQNEIAKDAEQSILGYIINMSHGIGMQVVA
ncbi:MAG: EAL domain-containing protein, partial [Wujia sp.]